jgi:hypothetical protein
MIELFRIEIKARQLFWLESMSYIIDITSNLHSYL